MAVEITIRIRALDRHAALAAMNEAHSEILADGCRERVDGWVPDGEYQYKVEGEFEDDE